MSADIVSSKLLARLSWLSVLPCTMPNWFSITLPGVATLHLQLLGHCCAADCVGVRKSELLLVSWPFWPLVCPGEGADSLQSYAWLKEINPPGVMFLLALACACACWVASPI